MVCLISKNLEVCLLVKKHWPKTTKIRSHLLASRTTTCKRKADSSCHWRRLATTHLMLFLSFLRINSAREVPEEWLASNASSKLWTMTIQAAWLKMSSSRRAKSLAWVSVKRMSPLFLSFSTPIKMALWITMSSSLWSEEKWTRNVPTSWSKLISFWWTRKDHKLQLRTLKLHMMQKDIPMSSKANEPETMLW